MNKEFEQYAKKTNKEAAKFKLQFLKNILTKPFPNHSQGATLQYDRSNDYLYFLFGVSPKQGIALDLGPFTAMVDPDTSEWLGYEIPFFMQKVQSGKLKGTWRELAKLMGEHEIVYLAPQKRIEQAEKQMKKELAAYAAIA